MRWGDEAGVHGYLVGRLWMVSRSHSGATECWAGHVVEEPGWGWHLEADADHGGERILGFSPSQ